MRSRTQVAHAKHCTVVHSSDCKLARCTRAGRKTLLGVRCFQTRVSKGVDRRTGSSLVRCELEGRE